MPRRKKRKLDFIPDFTLHDVLAGPSPFGYGQVTHPALPLAATTNHTLRPCQTDIKSSTPGSSSSSSTTQPAAPLLAKRRDTPVIVPSRRANKARALEVAGSPALLAEAVDAVNRDVRSINSAGPLSSYIKTWEEFHCKIFGDSVDIVPLTHEKIFKIGAVFKAGGYRSFNNYVEAVKEIHLKDFEWTTMLARSARNAVRAVTRGIGPAKQACGFDLFAVAALPPDEAPCVPSGPIFPTNMAILGSFFILREIEASLALASSVTLDLREMRITWNLPASKTDPRALGKTRSWGCTCNAEYKTPCPFHSGVERHRILLERFATNGVLPIDLPYFPTATGHVASKDSVVKTFEQLAILLDKPIVSADNQRLWGGHTLRVTGAQHLAMLGVELVVIALLARWASAVVLRYAAEAPLSQLTDTYKQKLHTFNFRSFMSQMRNEMDEAKQTVLSLHDDYKNAIQEELQLQRSQHVTPLQQPTEDPSPTTCTLADKPKLHFILNDDTEVIHAPAIHGLNIPPQMWATRCGWRFGFAMFSTPEDIPSKHKWKNICKKCLKSEREQRRDNDEQEDSSSSGGSSSSSSSND